MKYCYDPRHDEPCPNPQTCIACQEECQPMRPYAKSNLETCKYFCRLATKYCKRDLPDESIIKVLDMALEAYQYYCYFNQGRR